MLTKQRPTSTDKVGRSSLQLTPSKSCSSLKSSIKSNKIQVGKYEYDPSNILGKGYTGEVYKGTLIEDGRKKFAIKAIDMSRFKKQDEIALIERQIEIHKKLNHPNIIKCFDIYKTEETYYLVTEYCPHGDLQELMKSQKVISEDVALKIMKQVIQGYKYLMGKNIIHRDLKPANIMRFGSTWKIGDFGFAIYCNEDFILDQINVGTPLYMPPQSLFHNKYSHKTDIFSIGIMFYEMLTGITPWPSKDEKQLVQTMADEEMEIPDIIREPIIRQYLFKTCHIDYYTRMTKQMFKKFSFQQAEERLTKSKGKSMNYASKSLKKMILLSPKSSHKSSKNIMVKRSPFMSPKNDKMVRFEYYTEKTQSGENIKNVKENIERIKLEEEIGNKIYFLIQNIKSFKLQKTVHNRFIVLLYRYLLRHLKMIANPKQNSLKLSSWDATKKNQGFLMIGQKIDKKIHEYNANYLGFLETIDDRDVKHINRLFPQLRFQTHLSNGFYSNFQYYLKNVVNENLAKMAQEKKFVVPMEMRVGHALKGLCEIIKEKARDQKTMTTSKRLYGMENEDVCNEKAFKQLMKGIVNILNDS